MKHEMPLLPYTPNALAPLMSAETIDYHYGKHLRAYVDKLNELAAGTAFEDMKLEEVVRKASGPLFNNAAQVWNHTFFFDTLSPKQTPMSATLTEKLTKAFGSVESFKEKIFNAATTLFGSGWVWLASDKDGALTICAEPNAGNPLTNGLTPLLAIDVWEHAYYIDFRNSRPNYLNALWKLIDWDKVEKRMRKTCGCACSR